MGIFIWLFCFTFLQYVFGHVPTFTGQNTVNSGSRPTTFANTNARGLPNPQLPRSAANEVQSANQIVRNAAINGNTLATAATSNIASANLGNQNLINQLSSGNLGNANFASQNLAINIPGTKLESGNYANLGYADPSFTNLANSNFVNSAPPDLANQMYPITHTKIARLAENVASPYMATNNFNSNCGNLNYANGLGGISNPNLANHLHGNLGNFGNGNIANAINNLANGLGPEAVTFKIGDNPFQVISGSPGGHQLGLHVVADALEVEGTVSVAGKMPIYGTVSLSGDLPTDGIASVNYGCTSQANV